MSDNPSRPSRSDQEQGTRRLLLSAGTAYGFAYGLCFALLTWGYDAYLLSSLRADLAWGKLAVGLPLALLICILVGRRAVAAPPLARFLGYWPITSGVLGGLAAHVMLSATNGLVWIVDPRFSQLPIFLYGRPDAIRTGFVVLVLAVLGATVGLVQSLAMDWAWDRATPAGRMGWRSWMVMLLCVPLAIFPAVTVNQLVHRPLRAPQQALGEYLGLVTTATAEEVEAAGVSLNVIRGLQEHLSEQYSTHLVEFDPDSEAWYSARVDAAFDDGFVMRCITFGKNVVHCSDHSERLATWMSDLIHAGLGGARRWETADRLDLVVRDGVVAWLTDRRHRLSQNYTVSWEVQRGGWVLVSAQCDTGFRMGCYFRGARPVVVDHCVDLPAPSDG